MASPVVRARLDPSSAEALALLKRAGMTDSQAVRTALVEAARERERVALRAEVRRLAEDPVDTAVRKAVLEDMESMRPDWPPG